MGAEASENVPVIAGETVSPGMWVFGYQLRLGWCTLLANAKAMGVLGSVSYAVETAFATTLSGVLGDDQWLGTISGTARGAQGTFIFNRLPQATLDKD